MREGSVQKGVNKRIAPRIQIQVNEKTSGLRSSSSSVGAMGGSGGKTHFFQGLMTSGMRKANAEALRWGHVSQTFAAHVGLMEKLAQIPVDTPYASTYGVASAWRP